MDLLVQHLLHNLHQPPLPFSSHSLIGLEREQALLYSILERNVKYKDTQVIFEKKKLIIIFY